MAADLASLRALAALGYLLAQRRHYDLAQAALGRHREAVRCLSETTGLQPMNGHAWYALGMAWHHSREPDKVKEVAEHLVRIDPQMTRRLIQETGRADLAHLVAHLAKWG